MRRSRWALAGTSLCLLALPTLTQAQQEVGKDVPPTHWAYQAVQDLAGKGLIKGYPPDGNFLGGRTLTRYEMATLLQRVLARMDDLVSKAASKDDLDKLTASLGEIRQLVEGFKTELTVIGTDMERVQSELSALKGQVGDLDSRIGSLSKKVDETNVAVDQALENVKEMQRTTSEALSKKVNVGNGTLKVSGLLQVWYGNALGKTLGGNNPTNFSSGGQGRNFGGGVGDTFRIRRGELFFIGNILPKVDYRVMFDVAKIVSVSSTTATVGGASVVTGVSSSASSNILQDLWVGYQLFPRWRLEVGQQKTGLSEEGNRSSGDLLTVARSIMNEDLPATAGRIGNIRDAGAVLRYRSSKLTGQLGVWNDNGATQNSVDTDRQKFFDYNLFYTGIRHLTFGVWGGTNVGDTTELTTRDRLGGTFIAQGGPHFFEAEYAYTDDAAKSNRTIATGGYALYGYSLSKQWQLVGRYDEWDPAYHGGKTNTATAVSIPAKDHNLREYTFGINYYLRGHNAKIQLNYIRDDVQKNGVGFFGQGRSILLTNFQTEF